MQNDKIQFSFSLVYMSQLYNFLKKSVTQIFIWEKGDRPAIKMIHQKSCRESENSWIFRFT